LVGDSEVTLSTNFPNLASKFSSGWIQQQFPEVVDLAIYPSTIEDGHSYPTSISRIANVFKDFYFRTYEGTIKFTKALVFGAPDDVKVGQPYIKMSGEK
jgi:hypothetical protein